MGLLLAGLSALLEATKDTLAKANLFSLDEYVVSFALRASAFITLGVLFCLSLLISSTPQIEIDRLVLALFLSGIGNTVTTVLYMRALKSSDISVTVPILTFSPVFLLITSPIILGEFPTHPLGIVGVLLVVAGAYALNLRQHKQGYTAPFRALFSESGPRLMLLVTLIWAFTGNFDKMGVQASSPLFFSTVINGFMTVTLFPFLLKEQRLRQLKVNSIRLAPVGLASAFSILSLNTALGMTLVVYAVAIKRTSVLMGVLSGALFFKEKRLRERFPAAIVMLAGAALILSSLI